MEITKEVRNKQTKELFITISDETKHIILRLQDGLIIESTPDYKRNDKYGIVGQFMIKKDK